MSPRQAGELVLPQKVPLATLAVAVVQLCTAVWFVAEIKAQLREHDGELRRHTADLIALRDRQDALARHVSDKGTDLAISDARLAAQMQRALERIEALERRQEQRHGSVAQEGPG